MNILHFIKKPIVSKSLCEIAFLGKCRWHHCQHPAGIEAGVALSLLMLPCHRCHHCCCGTGVIVVVALALLQTPLGHCCHRNAVVITNVTLAPLPSLLPQCWRNRGPCLAFNVLAIAEHCPCHTRVPASITLALLPLLYPRNSQHCTGIFALVALVPLPLSRWRHRLCCADVVALVAPAAILILMRQRRDVLPLLWHLRCCHAGTFVNIAWALSPLLRWRPHRRCPGAVTIITVVALVSLRSWRWRHCHHCHCGAGVIVVLALVPLPMPLGHCCHCNAGDIADVALALLPLLLSRRWRHQGSGLVFDVPANAEHHPCCTCVPASITLALPPLTHPRHCQHCAGIFAPVALVPLPLSCWHCCPSHARSHRCPYAQPMGRPSAVVVLASLLRWHCCQCCLGIVTVAALASLQTYPWRRCHHHHHDVGVIAVLALALLPTLPLQRWRPRGCGAGAIANIAWTLLPLQRWRPCGRCPGAVFRGVPPSLSTQAAPHGLRPAAPRPRAAALLELGTAPLLPL